MFCRVTTGGRVDVKRENRRRFAVLRMLGPGVGASMWYCLYLLRCGRSYGQEPLSSLFAQEDAREWIRATELLSRS